MKHYNLCARIEQLEQTLDIERAAYERLARENNDLREQVRRLSVARSPQARIFRLQSRSSGQEA